MNKTFLKWAGNKFKLMPILLPHFAGAKRIVDPFMGGGSLMMNHEAKQYIGGDVNNDLVKVFNLLKTDGQSFIDSTEVFFAPEFHGKEAFYEMRRLFNELMDNEDLDAVRQRAAMFIALNKTCFNGLCRYNRHGAFTTPWNHAPKPPKFPRAEMLMAMERTQTAIISHASFEETIKDAKKGDAIYCDPPYLPKDGKDDAFVDYAKGGFSLEQQRLVVDLAQSNLKRGAITVISNQDCAAARELYKNATEIIEIDVKRSINRYKNHAETNSAKEVLAIYRS